MNFSTFHTREMDETYFEHLRFAAGCGLRLAASACIFLVHAAIPWIKIPTRLNLVAMTNWMDRKAKDRLTKRGDLDF